MLKNKKLKFLLGIFVILSIGLNITLIVKYDISGKLRYKLNRFFDSSPTALSAPLSNDHKPIVSYLINDSISRLTISSEETKQVIPDQLIIQPGTYNYLGDSYSLNKEGLYRTVRTDQNGVGGIQRIVYQNDIDALLSSLSWIMSQGYSDIPRTDLELKIRAKSSKLRLTCGPTSQWIKYILTSLNIESRLVKTMTLDEWNYFDDGHALIEVWREKWGKWVVYDLTNDSYFKPKNGGSPFSLIEFFQMVASDNYEIIPLSLDTPFEMTAFRLDKPSYSEVYGDIFYWEEMHVNIRNWYRRIMQVPFIFDTSRNMFLFMDKINTDRIEQRDRQTQYLSEKKWIDKFYNN